MKKLLLAVVLIGTMTAFGAARQAPEPNQMMQMMEMMKACPMNIDGAEVAISDTPDGVAVTFTSKSGNVDELRKRVRSHLEMMKAMKAMKGMRGGKGATDHDSHHQ